MPVSPDTLHYRVATAADIPRLHSLIDRSVRQLQAQDYTPAQLDGALGTYLGVDTQLIADGTYFVVEAPDANPEAPFIASGCLVASGGWSRCGIGTKILERCESAARAEGFTRFEMGATLTGVRLYVRHGYIEVERLAMPLPNGESLPIVRMTKGEP